ncbi:putative bifunctional diguanylate cyclase/phosphodiesterase [Paracraurococcus ruber]|uniref:Uncharacterized protein n=1 Tax=Paracraurococcus ruber TaxID=77675 RepID=A0ABS1D4C6_9PROT|nr:EAL domain-containing protein [Paracraurococcus ruber]MBK1661619.1 hypothetical protein [Paracraurococcus ruber]TDG18536.1 EAL domain-containing protein [Paracraurococcus ruber]
MALTDPLTGLANRLGFAQRAEAMLAGLARADRGGLLLSLDFDRFKWVNDTHGHAMGDRLLVAVADRLRRAAGDAALVARLGGDEFAVLVPADPAEETGRPLADRLLAALRAPLRLPDLTLETLASIGVARFPDDGSTLDGLLTAADAAMYEAKRAGRNRSIPFGPAIAQEIGQRRVLEAVVRQAIETDGLEMHFQPVLALASRRVSGAEALVRFRHPDLGPVPPDAVIRAAEQSGQIAVLGRMILGRVVAAAGRLAAAAGDPEFYVTANLSAGQVTDDLASQIQALLARHAVPPRRIVLEITETALFGDERRAAQVLADLSGLGLRLALDDFGSGYSSLNYVTRFPVDIIKVDRSFTIAMALPARDAATQARQAVVRSIVALAEALGKPLVAEGIETPEELAAAERLRFTHGQGFHFARPMPCDDLCAWLAARRPRPAAGHLRLVGG